MFDKLLNILRQSNSEYFCTYEEKSMMNIKVDEISRDKSYAYIEEFRQGRYSKGGRFWKNKTTRVQIWFCKATDFQNEAIQREQLRKQIEQEIVLPFMENYNKEQSFKPIDDWEWFTPPSRFDENEVSIMLQFIVEEINC